MSTRVIDSEYIRLNNINFVVGLKSLLTKLANYVDNEMKSTIKKQVGIDGRAFKPLKESTIKRKIKKGAKFPTMRMIDTGDFLDKYVKKVIEERRAILFVPALTHKSGKVTYFELAGYQNLSERGLFWGLNDKMTNECMNITEKYIIDTIDKEAKKGGF